MNPECPTLLVIGSTGQLGWELVRAMAPLGRVVGASLEGHAGPIVDLSRPGSLSGLVAAVKPDVLINASAYTAVDRAEEERELAALINVDAVGEMGRLAAGRGIPVIHYSTDFVFSGDADHPYREDDAAAPLGVYGETKLAGEQTLAGSGADHLIFRTSWVYGVRGQNFMLTMRRLFRERDELQVVDDQIGAPTWSRMLAEATAQVVGRALYAGLDLPSLSGVYHMSAAGSTSWYGFARAILEGSGVDCRLTPIPTSEYPTAARRPAYSGLDNSRLAQTFGLALPDWRAGLAQCLDDLNERG
jgi:dTDP-4-dehydrorhamnose reductase